TNASFLFIFILFFYRVCSTGSGGIQEESLPYPFGEHRLLTVCRKFSPLEKKRFLVILDTIRKRKPAGR
ncbi:hypothetical protein, partial [Akkermansia sp.]|uniref:hypothetical protein n=1 Tax=Akkermansia sp. TaxID=1872421 RepID=UPI003AAE0769